MALPDDVQWEEPHHLVCFNDECSYYREGWAWMEEKFGAKASYRYRIIDAERGTAKPLAAWSDEAHRDRIIGDKES